jgi:hypothetical protein
MDEEKPDPRWTQKMLQLERHIETARLKDEVLKLIGQMQATRARLERAREHARALATGRNGKARRAR